MSKPVASSPLFSLALLKIGLGLVFSSQVKFLLSNLGFELLFRQRLWWSTRATGEDGAGKHSGHQRLQD